MFQVDIVSLMEDKCIYYNFYNQRIIIKEK